MRSLGGRYASARAYTSRRRCFSHIAAVSNSDGWEERRECVKAESFNHTGHSVRSTDSRVLLTRFTYLSAGRKRNRTNACLNVSCDDQRGVALLAVLPAHPRTFTKKGIDEVLDDTIRASRFLRTDEEVSLGRISILYICAEKDYLTRRKCAKNSIRDVFKSD